MMRTLFLQAPSFDGFDGGAGSRYQAKREIKLVLVSDLAGAAGRAGARARKLIDAPPHRLGLDEVVAAGRATTTSPCCTPRRRPSRRTCKVIEALKAANPGLKVGLIGAKVAVQPDASLAEAPAIDFVARNEFDFTVKEVAEGRDWSRHRGPVAIATPAACIVHNADRADPRGHGQPALRDRRSTSAT